MTRRGKVNTGGRSRTGEIRPLPPAPPPTVSSIGDNSTSDNAEHISGEPTESPSAAAAEFGNENVAKPPPPEGPEATSTRKRKISWVWEHFTELPYDVPQKRRATCNYCKKSLSCPSASGTSCLSNHLRNCKKYPLNVSKGQQTLAFKPGSSSNSGSESLSSWKFDQDECRKYLAMMIMLDELPFKFVEHQGFREFCRILQPLFVVPSRTTVARDVYNCYKSEKLKLQKFLNKLSSRVCLTTDSWTSNQNLSYMCLTLHFIDDDWVLNKRIINFCPISGHSGEVIGKSIERCLLEWEIEKVFAITVDNASANDVAVSYLKRRLNSWKGSVLNGEYLHMRCSAHILNLVVKDGLSEANDSIVRIRSAIKYVRSSPARFTKFKNCAIQEKLDISKLLCLDVETRWNSTYMMLECALKFEKAFELLAFEDSKYAKDVQEKPMLSDWDYVRCLLPFLEMFYKTTLKLSGSLYVTSNEYMKQIYGLGMMIKSMCENRDVSLKLMASKMQKKYDKYWGDVKSLNIMMFIAVVLDPRHKMEYVEWTIDQSYDVLDAMLLKDNVKSVLNALFEFYSTSKIEQSVPEEVATRMTQDDSLVIDKIDDASSFIDKMFKRQKVYHGLGDTKTELEKYLSEDLEAENPKFDILNWWKVNSTKYQVLGMMAKDVLAIPVSTVASESAFSAGGRVLDSFRSSLTPRFVEALICGQDWVKHPSKSYDYVDQILLEQEIAQIESSCVTDDHHLILIDE